MAELVRLGRENIVEQLHRFSRASHAAEHQGKVCPRCGPAGRKLHRPAEQILGIAPAADPRRKLRQHADCRGVERIFLEVRLQHALGDVEPVLVERHRRLDQARMPMAASGRLGCHVRSLGSPRLAPSGSRRYAPRR